jgi:hypothetical protein
MKQFYFLFLFVWLIACEDNSFDFETTDTIVIEAYIHNGNPVTEINISQLIPLISDSTESYEVNDADVFIEWNDQTYSLIPGTEDGVYIYPDDDLEINVGDSYTLSVDYLVKTTISTTRVPNVPTGLALNKDELEIPVIDDFTDLFNLPDLDPIEVYWDNPGGNYHYVVIENLENNPEEINQLDLDFDRSNFFLVTPPTNLDVYNLAPGDITQFGTHRVIVYRVNQEYVDLYDSSEQDSRNLTEPRSNIENGVGIFTAFSSDTTFFEIKKDF